MTVTVYTHSHGVERAYMDKYLRRCAKVRLTLDTSIMSDRTYALCYKYAKSGLCMSRYGYVSTALRVAYSSTRMPLHYATKWIATRYHPGGWQVSLFVPRMWSDGDQLIKEVIAESQVLSALAGNKRHAEARVMLNAGEVSGPNWEVDRGHTRYGSTVWLPFPPALKASRITELCQPLIFAVDQYYQFDRAAFAERTFGPARRA